MKKINIRRYNPNKEQANSMHLANHGGWVPYTDYCRKVSRLEAKISRLQETIIRSKMGEVGM